MIAVARREIRGALWRLKRLIFSFGWDVHPFDPDRSIGTYLTHLFLLLSIDCVIDVGARNGEFGRLLREHGYRGRIISFEPVPTTFEHLQQRAARDPLWDAYQVALGSENTLATINVMRSSEFSSFLAPIDGSELNRAGWNAVVRQEQVPVRRLDDILPDILPAGRSSRIYLKMDTQGWDLEVLRGAEQTLSRVQALQSEMSIIPIYDGSPPFSEALASLKQRGFAASAMFGVSRDPQQRLREFDCVMVRSDEPCTQLADTQLALDRHA
ncbi:MAG: FkbM family methyltransferase [Chloroflexota bacterium]